MIEGLTNAAMAFAATDWLAALWDHGAETTAAEARNNKAVQPPASLQRILEAMPPAEAEPRLAQLLDARADWQFWRISAAIAVLPRPWSQSLALRFLKWFWRVAGKSDLHSPAYYEWASSAATAGVAIPESCFDEALRDRPAAIEDETKQIWQTPFENFQETIRLRRRLREALASTH
jgi:hypothetical protein